MPATLSACTIARNAADLRRCLASVAFADEIVVVADDRTGTDAAEVARRHGARVLVHAGRSDVASRRLAFSEARGDWILLVDADEELSPELGAEIRAVLHADDLAWAGYELRRSTSHLGHRIRHGAFAPEWVLRLVRRGAERFEGVGPHGRLHADGPLRRLEGRLDRHGDTDLADLFRRIQTCSDASASALRARGEHATLEKLLLRPAARFLRDYVGRRGFLDGAPGFFLAASSAFQEFVQYAKLWELERSASD